MINKKIYNCKDVRDADYHLINNLKMPSIALMELAATRCTDYILNKFQFDDVLIICGASNNAGDGYAIARQLNSFGKKVSVLKIFEPKSEDCIINFDICMKSGIHIFDSINEYVFCKNTIIIDCVYGSGFKGILPKNIQNLFNCINSIKFVKKISVDVPSGLDLNTGVSSPNTFISDYTLCIGALKKGYYSNQAIYVTGNISCIDIGLRPEDINSYKIIQEEDVLLPDRRTFFHKGDAGKVAVIGGSKEYPGAPVLSSLAAFRGGAGLVYCFLPECLYGSHYGNSSEIIFKFGIENNIDKYIDFLNFTIDCVVCGPGSAESYSLDFWKDLFLQLENKTIVIDADIFKKINVEDLPKGNNNKYVLTPHLKEFSEFSRVSMEELNENMFELFEIFCQQNPEIYLILKKPYTLCGKNNNYNLIPIIESALTHGGSGDVLSGMLGAFLCQYKKINIDIISNIVYMHSYIAEKLACDKFSGSVIPSDIIENMGVILNEFRK